VRLYRVSCVVIRQRDLGEADRVLSLYTRERGKLSAVAKGIRRPRSKFAGSLQLFSHASVHLAAGRSLEVVTQARALDTLYNLRMDMVRFAHASYAAELLDTLTDEGLPDPVVYDLIASTLTALNAGGDAPTLIRAFELKLLAQLGYGPELDSCVSCSAQVTARGRGFSVAEGGVLCASCTEERGVARLSSAALRALRELRQRPTEAVAERRLSSSAREELEQLMRPFVDSHVGRELRSTAFLKGEPGSVSR
jgi:DNA repair protein RecO (recombination protein O)